MKKIEVLWLFAVLFTINAQADFEPEAPGPGPIIIEPLPIQECLSSIPVYVSVMPPILMTCWQVCNDPNLSAHKDYCAMQSLGTCNTVYPCLQNDPGESEELF